MTSDKLLSKKKGYVIFGILGFLYIFFWRTGKDLAETGNIVWTGTYLFKLLIWCLLPGSALGCVICSGLYGLAEGSWSSLCGRVFRRKDCPAEKSARNRRRERLKEHVEQCSPAKIFLCSTALLLLCWLPAFLAYFPGNCAYDTPIQTGQIVDGRFNDHHPIFHTLLIKGAMKLGEHVLGDINSGIAFYTFLQMVFLAVVMGYGLVLLARFRVKIKWRVLVLGLCMFHPFNWHMGISMTKDTLFSAFLLLWICAFLVILREDRKGFRLDRMDFLLGVSTIGMILLRNNAKYALLVPLFFVAMACLAGKKGRKMWVRLLAVCSVSFLLGCIFVSSLFRVTQAVQGDRREMLSMPIQQLSRVMIYHGGIDVLKEDDHSLDKEDKALIDEFIHDQAYREYQPSLADPVKRHTNTSVVRYQPVKFAKTYLKLLVKYPGDFVNAVLAVNAGFLYPGDESHAYVNENEALRGLGYMQTRWEEDTLNERGIYKASLWPALFERLEEWSDENGYLNWPLIRYLCMPGGFLWFWILYAGYLLIRKDFRMLLPVALVGGYYLTMFFGPTVQLRYVYPVMISLPYMILLSNRRNTEQEVEAMN